MNNLDDINKSFFKPTEEEMNEIKCRLEKTGIIEDLYDCVSVITQLSIRAAVSISEACSELIKLMVYTRMESKSNNWRKMHNFPMIRKHGKRK